MLINENPIDGMDSLVSVLSAPYQKLADSLALVARIQSELLNKPISFNWTPIAILASLAFVFVTHQLTKLRDKEKERKRIWELWNLINIWIAATNTSIMKYFTVFDYLAKSFEKIDNLSPNLVPLDIDVTFIQGLSKEDLYKAFISKRIISTSLEVESFHTVMTILNRFKVLTEKHNKILNELNIEIQNYSNKINNSRMEVGLKEQKILSTINEMPYKWNKETDEKKKNEIKEKGQPLSLKFSEYSMLVLKNENFEKEVEGMGIYERLEYECNKKIEFLDDEIDLPLREDFLSLRNELDQLFINIGTMKAFYIAKSHYFKMTKSIYSKSIISLTDIMKLYQLDRNGFVSVSEF